MLLSLTLIFTMAGLELVLVMLVLLKWYVVKMTITYYDVLLWELILYLNLVIIHKMLALSAVSILFLFLYSIIYVQH